MPRSNTPTKNTTHGKSHLQRPPSYTGALMPRPLSSLPAQQVNVASSTGLFQSMKEGFGWGVGSSIARNMFGGVVSTSAPPAATSPAATPRVASTSEPNQLIYNKCMEDNHNNHEECKQYIV